MADEISPELLAHMQANISDDDRPKIIVIITIFTCLAIIAVILRFVSRRRTRAAIKADDYLIVFGLILVIATSITAGLMVMYGLGRHIILVTNRKAFIGTVLATEALYAFSIIPIKLSILFLYHRFFPSPTLNRISIGTGIFVSSYLTILAVCVVTQCIPISSFWTGKPGKCMDFAAVLLVCSIFNVLTDILILALPIPFLWHLKIKRAKRMQLMATFSIGGVVTVCSAVRTWLVHRPSTADKSWSDVDATIISVCEISIGVLAACLPTYRPLFVSRGALPSTFASSSRYAEGSENVSRSVPGFRASVLNSHINKGNSDREDWIQLNDPKNGILVEESASDLARDDSRSHTSDRPQTPNRSTTTMAMTSKDELSGSEKA